MAGELLYLDRLDVAHDELANFNRRYEREVLPELRKVPGVLRLARYQTKSRRDPRYLTIYEIADPAVAGSRAFIAAKEKAAWSDRLLPFVINRRDGVYARIGGSAGLAYRTRYLLFVSIDIETPKEKLLNELYEFRAHPVAAPVAGRGQRRALQGCPRESRLLGDL